MFLSGPIGMRQLEAAHDRLDFEPTPNIRGALLSLSGKTGLDEPSLDLTDRVREHWLRRLGEATGSGGRYQKVIVAEVRAELELWLNYYAVRSRGAGAEDIARPSERV